MVEVESHTYFVHMHLNEVVNTCLNHHLSNVISLYFQLEGEESCQNKNLEVLSASQLLSGCSWLNSPPVVLRLTVTVRISANSSALCSGRDLSRDDILGLFFFKYLEIVILHMCVKDYILYALCQCL